MRPPSRPSPALDTRNPQLRKIDTNRRVRPGLAGAVQSLGVRRLLGQSRRPQAFCTIEVHPGAPDPVAAKIEDDRLCRINWHAATLATSPYPTQEQDPVAKIAKLLSDDL